MAGETLKWRENLYRFSPLNFNLHPTLMDVKVMAFPHYTLHSLYPSIFFWLRSKTRQLFHFSPQVLYARLGPQRQINQSKLGTMFIYRHINIVWSGGFFKAPFAMIVKMWLKIEKRLWFLIKYVILRQISLILKWFPLECSKNGISIHICLQSNKYSIEWMSEDSIFIINVEQYSLSSRWKRLPKSHFIVYFSYT